MSGKTDGIILKAIDSISEEKIGKIALFAFITWTVFPIVIYGLNYIGFDSYKTIAIWKMALYLSGGCGLFFGGIVIYKIFNSEMGVGISKVKEYLSLVLIVMFALWCILSTFFAAEKRIAIYGYELWNDCLFVYLFYIGMAFLGVALSVNKHNLIVAANVYLLISVITSSISFVDSKFTRQICRIELDENYESVSAFLEPAHFAHYLIIAISLALVMLFFRKDSKIRIAYMLVYAYLLFSLANNGTFISLVGVLIMVLLFSIHFITNGRFKKQVFEVFALTVLSLVLAIMFGKDMFSGFLHFKGTLFSLFDGANNVDIGLVNNIEESLAYIGNKPVVGVGPQNLLFGSRNLMLKLAMFLGAPGMLIYVSAITVTVKRAFCRSDSKDFCFAIIFVIALYLWSVMFNTTSFYIAPFFYIVLGSCLLEGLKKPKQSRN